MESNLRPLTLGEILDRTAQLYRTNFLLFAGIFAVYSGVALVLNLFQIGLKVWVIGANPSAGASIVQGLGQIGTALVVFLFAGAAIAALNRAVAWVHMGEPATIRGAYASILPRLGRYMWLMTITAFFIWAPLIVLAFIIGIVIAAVPGFLPALSNPSDPQSAMNILMIFFVVLMLLLPWIAYAIFMALRYSLAVPACVVENLKARKAIRRSIELSKGARGRIFVLGLLVFVIELGLSVTTQGFFFVYTFKHHLQELPAWMQALQQVLVFFTGTFVGPIYAAGLALFYYDQRIRKEGYDIEWMMQAAGLTVPEPVAEQPAAEPPLLAPQEPEEAHE
jgi:uncharacterized membrane protein